MIRLCSSVVFILPCFLITAYSSFLGIWMAKIYLYPQNPLFFLSYLILMHKSAAIFLIFIF